MRTVLKGITWDHSRALPPLVATAQRYEELHLEVRIIWEKRTLDEFGHKPIDELAEEYDLIDILPKAIFEAPVANSLSRLT